MLLLPTIELCDGRAAQRSDDRQGSTSAPAERPWELAALCAAAGAPRLHVEDRDAGHDPRVNQGVVAKILEATTVDVAVAGSLRTVRDCERVLTLGARWAVLDPEALAAPDEVERACQRFPRRILVTLVAHPERPPSAADPSLEASADPWDPVELGAAVVRAGAAGVVHADLATDGTSPAGLATTARLARRLTPCPVLHGGKLARLEDVDDVARTGAFAALIGPALYATQATLEAAIARAQVFQP